MVSGGKKKGASGGGLRGRGREIETEGRSRGRRAAARQPTTGAVRGGDKVEAVRRRWGGDLAAGSGVGGWVSKQRGEGGFGGCEFGRQRGSTGERRRPRVEGGGCVAGRQRCGWATVMALAARGWVDGGRWGWVERRTYRASDRERGTGEAVVGRRQVWVPAAVMATNSGGRVVARLRCGAVVGRSTMGARVFR